VDEEIALRSLVARAVEMGHRLKVFAGANGFHARGQLDLKVGGCFSFSWVDDKATHVNHASGIFAVPILAHCPITRDFSVEDNDGDWKAMAILDPTEHSLMRFFPKEADFVKDMYIPGKKVSVLKVFAKRVADQVMKERASGQVSDSVSSAAISCLKEAATEKRQANLNRARAKLDEAKNARQTKRVIKL